MSKLEPEREHRWRAVMSEWEQSGLSMRAFCRDRRINVQTFYGWRRSLRQRDGQSADSSTPPRPNRKRRFVQVQVTGPSWLELSLGGELVLRMPTSVDGGRLAEILAAARKATEC